MTPPLRAGTRRLVDLAACTVAKTPGADQVLRRAAIAPVHLKTPLFEKIASRIAGKLWARDSIVTTNAGVTDELRLGVPATKLELIFGSLERNLGERATLSLVRNLARASDAFVDVGANDGLFSFAIAADWREERHSRIHAFEPDKAVFQRLAANLGANGIRAHVHPVAVSNCSGTTTFYRDLDADDMGSLDSAFNAGHRTSPIEVEVVTLASYMRQHNIERACLKVDVEGSGLAVWEGMRDVLARINWLVMEIVGPEWDACLPGKILAESGWCAYYIRDFELIQWTGGNYPYLDRCYNWLFCPTDAQGLSRLLAGSAFQVVEASSS